MITLLLCLFANDIGQKSIEALSQFAQRNDNRSFSVKTTIVENDKVLTNKLNEFCFEPTAKKSLQRETHIPSGDYTTNVSSVVLTNGSYKADLFKPQDRKWIVTAINNKFDYLALSDGKKLPWNCYLKGIGVATLNSKDYKFHNYSETPTIDGLIWVKSDLEPTSKKGIFNRLEFLVNPKHGYRLEKFVLKATDLVIHGEKKFNPTDPLILTEEVHKVEGERNLTATYTFAYNPNVKESDYYLPAYQIAEPTKFEPDYSIYYIIMAGIMVLIVLSLRSKV